MNQNILNIFRDSSSDCLEVPHDLDWIKSNPSEVFQILKTLKRKNDQPYSDSHKKNILTYILTQFNTNENETMEKNRQMFRAYHRDIQRHMTSNNTNESTQIGGNHTTLTWQDVIDKREELSNSESGSKRHLLLCLLTYFDSSLYDLSNIKILSRSPNTKEKQEYHGGYLVLNKRVFKLYSKTRAFGIQLLFDHLNTRRVWYTDPHYL